MFAKGAQVYLSSTKWTRCMRLGARGLKITQGLACIPRSSRILWAGQGRRLSAPLLHRSVSRPAGSMRLSRHGHSLLESQSHSSRRCCSDRCGRLADGMQQKSIRCCTAKGRGFANGRVRDSEHIQIRFTYDTEEATLPGRLWSYPRVRQ